MLFSTDVEGSFEFGVLSKWMMGVLSIPPNFYTSVANAVTEVYTDIEQCFL